MQVAIERAMAQEADWLSPSELDPPRKALWKTAAKSPGLWDAMWSKTAPAFTAPKVTLALGQCSSKRRCQQEFKPGPLDI